MKVSIGNYPKNASRKRRIKVEVDQWDLFSMDHTLALVIVPMLKAFLNGPADRSIPAFCFPSLDGREDNYTSKEYATATKKWKESLESMLWSFEQIVGEQSFISDDTEEKIDVVSRYGAYQAKIQHGLDLFAKYYQHLWY